MKIAIVIACILLFFSGYVAHLALIYPADNLNLFDFSCNLITELFGILVTVLIVDFILERKEQTDALEEKAWELLHEIDYTFWVWQGGNKGFDEIELFQLASAYRVHSPIATHTRNLILRLGGRSSYLLNRYKEPLSRFNNHQLKFALTELAQLNNFPDIHLTPETEAIRMQKRDTWISISTSLSHFNNYLKLKVPNPLPVHTYIGEDNIENQERRFRG